MLTPFLLLTKLTDVKVTSLPFVAFPVALISPFGWTPRCHEGISLRRIGQNTSRSFGAWAHTSRKCDQDFEETALNDSAQLLAGDATSAR